MGGFWKLNGIELTAAQVRVVPTRLNTERRVKQVRVDQHDGSQYREKVGLVLPSLSIDIVFGGRGTPKFDEAAYVQQALEDNEVWTLEAPSLLPIYVFKNFKRAAISTESWSFDPGKATGRVTLTVQAVLNGIWIADGGTYCQGVFGTFTKVTSTTFRNDFTGVVDFLPLLTLPTQTTGYPRAINASYSYGVPALYSSTGTTQTFDMTGFLIPSPTTVGGVGAYEVCSSPAIPGTASPAPAGVGGAIIIPVQVQVAKTVTPGTLIQIVPGVTVAPLVRTTGASITEATTVAPTVGVADDSSSNNVTAVGSVADQSAAPSASYNITVVGSVTP